MDSNSLEIFASVHTVIEIACRRCDRRGQYRGTTLLARYGGQARLPDVLAALSADCPNKGKWGACSPYYPQIKPTKREG